jgi:L-cysteine desulfidase
LKPDEDGTRKRLSRTTVDNLKDFLNTVNARDITSDEAILKISEQAREILKNYSADDLKGKWTGERVQVGLDQVKRDLNDLIKRDQGRKIDLDLE